MMQNEWLKRIFWEYQSIFMYAGLALLGAILLWGIQSWVSGSMTPDPTPIPIEY